MRYACMVLFLALMGASAHADTVVMKSGQSLEGKVLNKTDEVLELEVEYGTVQIDTAKILRIEGDTPEQLQAREQKEEEKKAETEQALADGKVLYKGKWVTPDEKKADEAKLADKKKAHQAKLAAAKAAADAKQKADAAAAAAAVAKLAQTPAQNGRFARNHSSNSTSTSSYGQNSGNYNNQNYQNQGYQNQNFNNNAQQYVNQFRNGSQ